MCFSSLTPAFGWICSTSLLFNLHAQTPRLWYKYLLALNRAGAERFLDDPLDEAAGFFKTDALGLGLGLGVAFTFGLGVSFGGSSSLEAEVGSPDFFLDFDFGAPFAFAFPFAAADFAFPFAAVDFAFAAVEGLVGSA